MSELSALKEHKRALVSRYARPVDRQGWVQCVGTVGYLAAAWCLALWGLLVSWWLTAFAVLLMSVFTLRCFVLMHECGHYSVFKTPRFNRFFGSLFGVLTGTPQPVWSLGHIYHHAHNGNWDRYRGPLNTKSVDEYAAMSPWGQCRYRIATAISVSPIGGLNYLLYEPRSTWFKGSVRMLVHVVRAKRAEPGASILTHARRFQTPYWNTFREWKQMTATNVALLLGWLTMSLAIGPGKFIVLYLLSMSFGGMAAMILFTVQHNFEHSYASHDGARDFDAAALQGTSFVILPRWLDWFTANIGYHHIHHLSDRIPNYRLHDCHRENAHLFQSVRRIGITEIPAALMNILWDRQAGRIITVAEYEQRILA
jgi:omega-6 fatty acid desaturase (delta-12 desaturase)